MFIKGMELGESFFYECGLPIIKKYYPDLKFSAGLLGYGSDVLGYDDEVSTDHMWGPRFYLFLNDNDIHIRYDLIALFEENLPYTYKGYSVNFSKPNQDDNGVRNAEFINSGNVSPLIWIHTIDEFVNDYLGLVPENSTDWLSISENRLLGFTSGKLFIDNLKFTELQKKLSFYPHDVWLYLIASQWALISEEQAFVKRTSDCFDELGSQIICTRIAERLMRLCFLYCKKYAPYSKWFGTGFKQLPIDKEIIDEIYAAVSTQSISNRETHLVNSQVLIAELHNKLEITETVEINIQNYFDRSIKVIYAERLAHITKSMISCPVLKKLPSFWFVKSSR
jgi:hypothetical protein